MYTMSADWSEMRQMKRNMEAQPLSTETEITNPNWLEGQVHPQDRDRVQTAIEDAIREKSIFEQEYRVIREDGSLGWTLSRAVPLLDGDGEITNWFGAASDVTERKLGDDRKLESERQLREALEVTTDGVFSLDRNWNFVYLNSNARTLLAASGELIGRSYWEAYPENNREDSIFFLNYHKAMDEGIPSDFEGYYPEPYESWFQAIVRPTVQGITVFFRDVTASRKASAALIQSEKLADMGRLAASIAHEVNNPLEAVTNLLYLARTSKSLEDAAEYLETAEQELGRASAITNQTLRFHKQSTHPTEVTSGSLISGVLAVHHAKIVGAGLGVEERPRALRPIFCFEGEIRQVLSNLIGNAADAMQSGGRLLVRSRDGHNWRTGQQGLVITVADTGSGMARKTMKRVFEAFYTTKGLAGTGLGLWVSKEIVIRHQGALLVRSSQIQKKSGTVFSMFLPYDAVSRSDFQVV
jgi:PAS domain S-box-containing protein